MKRSSLRGKLSEQPIQAPPAVELPTLHVRPAAAGDIGAMIELLARLGRPAPTPDQAPGVVRIFEELIGREDFLARVAEHQGRLVGVLLGQLRPRANWLTPELWISDAALAEGAASETARHLLDEALTVAERWGCFQTTCDAALLPADLLAERGFVTGGPTFSHLPATTRGLPAARGSEAPSDGAPIVYRSVNL